MGQYLFCGLDVLVSPKALKGTQHQRLIFTNTRPKTQHCLSHSSQSSVSSFLYPHSTLASWMSVAQSMPAVWQSPNLNLLHSSTSYWKIWPNDGLSAWFNARWIKCCLLKLLHCWTQLFQICEFPSIYLPLTWFYHSKTAQHSDVIVVITVNKHTLCLVKTHTVLRKQITTNVVSSLIIFTHYYNMIKLQYRCGILQW